MKIIIILSKLICVIISCLNESLCVFSIFNNQINIINDDVLNVSTDKISKEKLTVFGNRYENSLFFACKSGENPWQESLSIFKKP